VHLVGFSIRIYDDARSSERQIFNNVKFATCFGYSNHHQADISVHVLMVVTVTEACNKLYMIEYIVMLD
jgi:hypothetical protein